MWQAHTCRFIKIKQKTAPISFYDVCFVLAMAADGACSLYSKQQDMMLPETWSALRRPVWKHLMGGWQIHDHLLDTRTTVYHNHNAIAFIGADFFYTMRPRRWWWFHSRCCQALGCCLRCISTSVCVTPLHIFQVGTKYFKPQHASFLTLTKGVLCLNLTRPYAQHCQIRKTEIKPKETWSCNKPMFCRSRHC